MKINKPLDIKEVHKKYYIFNQNLKKKPKVNPLISK
jgi:hypothetical protein